MMDLYILDDALRRSVVVDDFISLIWTERFNTFGDFELEIKSTQETRQQFLPDTWLTINQSRRVMIAETIENKTTDNGAKTLIVKGRSIETLLMNRVAKESFDDLTISPKWSISGLPADIARYIFNQICVDGLLDTADTIPFVVTGNIFPTDTIAEPPDSVVMEFDPETVYDTIKQICGSYELGFRLVLSQDTEELYFNIYSGVDRTSLQEVHTPILFSPELDNLQNQTEFISSQDEKNVAYVFSEFGTDIVFAPGVDPLVEGFRRKILLVNTTEINEDTIDVPASLIRIGNEALANAKQQRIFDGETSLSDSLVYGTDYNIGDVVEFRNVDGVVAYKRVTEFIFVSDSEGDRAYPTLAEGWDTNAETWSSISDVIVWDGYDAEVWDDFG